MTERIYDDDPRDWKSVDVHYDWAAAEVCFSCPCGVKEIILSEVGDMKRCKCGRVYTVVHYVAVDLNTVPVVEARNDD